MATVDGLTKDRMLAIEAESITAARVDPITNHLILTTHGGTDIDVGNVQGPQGLTGATGATGGGVPTGGAAGAELVKNSAADFDTSWQARYPNLPAPVTTGTTVQTFTDSLGDLWVAKNGVNGGAWKRARDVLFASVYRNAALTYPTVQGALALDSVTLDRYGLWVPASNHFVLPASGLWRVQIQLTGSNATVGSALEAYIVRSGSVADTIIQPGSENPSTSGFGGINLWSGGSKTFLSVAADVISPQVRASSTTSCNTGASTTYVTLKYEGTG